MSTVLQLVVALLGGGLLGRILFWRPERDTLIAEATDRAIAAMNASMDRVQSDLQASYRRMDALQSENDTLRVRIADLERQGVMCATCPLRREHHG